MLAQINKHIILAFVITSFINPVQADFVDNLTSCSDAERAHQHKKATLTEKKQGYLRYRHRNEFFNVDYIYFCPDKETFRSSRQYTSKNFRDILDVYLSTLENLNKELGAHDRSSVYHIYGISALNFQNNKRTAMTFPVPFRQFNQAFHTLSQKLPYTFENSNITFQYWIRKNKHTLLSLDIVDDDLYGISLIVIPAGSLTPPSHKVLNAQKSLNHRKNGQTQLSISLSPINSRSLLALGGLLGKLEYVVSAEFQDIRYHITDKRISPSDLFKAAIADQRLEVKKLSSGINAIASGCYLDQTITAPSGPSFREPISIMFAQVSTKEVLKLIFEYTKQPYSIESIDDTFIAIRLKDRTVYEALNSIATVSGISFSLKKTKNKDTIYVTRNKSCTNRLKAGSSMSPKTDDIKPDKHCPTSEEHKDGRRCEPLEYYPLESLLYVGTITDLSTREQYAVIEAPEDTTFIATIGHHLGRDYGKIVKIDDQKIHVEEIYWNKDDAQYYTRDRDLYRALW